MLNPLHEALRVLRLNQVRERTGKSRSSIYDEMAKGDFPSQIRIGVRAVGWVESEINAYIQARIAESRNLVNGGV